MGRYTVCQCGEHWRWDDKIYANPKGQCKGCQRAWLPQLQQRGDGAKGWQKPMQQRPKSHSWPKRTGQKTYKTALIEAPPGLAQNKGLKNKKWQNLAGAAQQHWETLPQSFKDVLTANGIVKQPEEKPVDLKELLKQHLAALPEVLKTQLEGIIQPKEEVTEKTTAAKMKSNVGLLRDLTNRRDGAQAKVDIAKEQYKIALQDLVELQKQIEKAQEDLKETTAAWEKLAMEKKFEEPPEETAIPEDQLWPILQAAGIAFDETQKQQMQKMMVEQQTKRRKTDAPPGEVPKCG